MKRELDALFSGYVQFDGEHLCKLQKVRVGSKDRKSAAQGDGTYQCIYDRESESACPAFIAGFGGQFVVARNHLLVWECPQFRPQFFVLLHCLDSRKNLLAN